MQWPRFRPRFEMPLAIPPEAFIAEVQAALKRPGAPVTGIIVPSQLELRIPEQDQRLLTPVLHIVVRSTDDGGHVMKARFAPHPHLWMLVVAVYFALALLAVAGAMYGFSLLILGGSLWPFLVVPGALAAGGFIHGAVLIGQGLSADHMHILRGFLECSIRDATRKLATEG